MNRNIKVPLGKKDSILRELWENVEVEAISKPINLAIAYYAKTGKFLEIGKVKDLKKQYENAVKYVYIPNNSIAFKFLSEKQEQGERVATLVKYILRNSITPAEETTVYDLDELRVRLEEIYHPKVEDKPVNNVIYVEKPIELEKPKETEPSKDLVPQKEDTPSSYEPIEGGEDLISALIGDINFSH